MAEKPLQRRPGGRTARNREQILRATTEMLLDEGYEQLTISRVAAAAGVAESTIYRRWPTRAHLAGDALGNLAALQNPIPDTGSLAGDLRLLLVQIIALLELPEIQRLVRTVVALDPADEGLAVATDAFWKTRFSGSAAIVVRAIERGEIRAGVDPYEVIEDLVGATYFRVLITGRPLDERLVDRAVRVVMHEWGTPEPNA